MCLWREGTPVKEVKAPYMDLVTTHQYPGPETHFPPAPREKDSSTAAVEGGTARDVLVEGGEGGGRKEGNPQPETENRKLGLGCCGGGGGGALPSEMRTPSIFNGLLRQSQGQNLVLTVSCAIFARPRLGGG